MPWFDLTCVSGLYNRLYSSAHFNDNFPHHSDPEVLRTPLEGVALVMKAMGIDKVLALLSPVVCNHHAYSCS